MIVPSDTAAERAEPRRVQSFRAPDARSALAAVRSALGDDAIIAGTREITGGLWGRPEVEITAFPAASSAPVETEQHLRAEIGSLRRVIEELRARLPTAGAAPKPSKPAPDLPPIYRRLVARGVEPSVAEHVIQQARQAAVPGGDLAAAVRAVIGRQLPVTTPPWKVPGRQLLALVGPTGVGKTTTIAKIAARALLETRRRIALITIDNYRIGAREHLAHYGAIMGVPLHAATDRQSLRAALARTAGADLVLVDTAGRSDGAAIAAQATMLRSEGGMDIAIALALSAASGSRELRAAARRFQALSPDRMIFTKLDEAEGPGGILSAAVTGYPPILCVTNGQRVPDDLHPATTATLVDIVAGAPAGANDRGPSR